ncbi:MAG: T9SS type A sorting domain-containing protein, partial [Bacteroidia bacterium]
LVAIQDTVYFCANEGNLPPADGVELWRTDGTTAGTVLVKDINPSSASSNISSLFVFNNKLFFSASNGNSAIGDELWISDGTNSGTNLLADIIPGSASSVPREFIALGNQVYFIATGAGDTLYQTDGTLASTYRHSAGMVQDIVILNNKLFFRASDNSNGYELWTFDPFISGIRLIEHDITIYPNPASDKIIVSSVFPIQEICIYTLSGQILMNSKANTVSEEIDIHDLSAGIYLISIRTSEGKFVQKIMRQ